MDRYELPDGWVWTTLGQICQVNPTMSRPSSFSDETPVSFVPMAAVDDVSGTIAQPQVRAIGEVWTGYKRFAEGDVIFARITPCMENGKAAIAADLVNGIGLGSTEFHVLRPTSVALAKWIFYFVRQESFRYAAVREMTGTAGQLRVPSTFMAEAAIPLPPMNEQRRIIAKIEALLAQARQAREALNQVPDLLKKFRQSLLSAAFRGDLTERDPADEPASALLERILADRRSRWEEDLRAKGKDPARYSYDEPVSPDTADLPELPVGWMWVSLDQLLTRIDAGHSPRAEGRPAGPGEYGVLKVSAVSWGEFLPEENKALIPGEQPSDAITVRRGDLLISRANTVSLVGAVVLVKEDYPHLMLSDKTLRLVPASDEIPPEYLLYALRTKWVREVFESQATGTSDSMRNISQAKIRTAPIPLPPSGELARIAQHIRTCYAQADAIGAAVEAARRRLNKLDQAILARAFRGELVSQDPDDEPATELLARLCQGHSAQTSAGKRRPSRPGIAEDEGVLTPPGDRRGAETEATSTSQHAGQLPLRFPGE